MQRLVSLPVNFSSPQREEEERVRGNLGPSAKLILPTDRPLISFSRLAVLLHAEAD